MSDCSRNAWRTRKRADQTDYDQSGVMRGKIVMKDPCHDIPIAISRYERTADGELLERDVECFEFEGDFYEKPARKPYREKDLSWMGD